MNKISPQVSQAAAKYHAAIVHLLVLLVLSFSISSTSVAATTGYPLVDSLTGTFGAATDFMKGEVTRVVEESGIKAAATEAKAALELLANGEVPVISDLTDPVHDNVEEAMADALSKVQIATKILNKISGEGAKNAIKFIAESPLFVDADFGLTLPDGRLRVYRKGLVVSVCRTTAIGPLGLVVVTGISNEKQLCHIDEPRMENPSGALIAFVDMAAGYSRIRVNLPIPDGSTDHSKLPAPIEAETFVKINNQWVQLHLAGADPASVQVEGRLAVGVKVGINDYLKAEVTGESTIKVMLNILQAAEVIKGATRAMLDKAVELDILDISSPNSPADSAAIVMAGLNHLGNLKKQFNEGTGDIEIGKISINAEATLGVGAGIWDTGIDIGSAGNEVSLSTPILPLLDLISKSPTLITDYISISMGMSDANLKLATAILEGQGESALSEYITTAKAASNDMVTKVFTPLLEATSEIELDSEFKLVALGTANTDATTLLKASISIPVGKISGILTNPNAIGDAAQAAAYILLVAKQGDTVLDESVWADLTLNVLPGIKYSYLTLPPVPTLGTRVGIKDVSLFDTLTMMAQSAQTMSNIIISVAQSAIDSSLAPLRSSLNNALTVHKELALKVIQESYISFENGIGINGDIGAEGVLKLGAGFNIESKIKTSVLLLLLDSPEYQEEHETILSETSLPISFTLGLGASIGEGVEFSVGGAGTVNLNLYELTAKNWLGALPTPATLNVAGFPVLEFNGDIEQDESFSGTGFLMLPLGGVVEADFSVAANGDVESGSNWTGGLDLGPMGKYPLITGSIANDGLHGNADITFYGSSINADFIIAPSGLLFGNYAGSLVIGDVELASASLYLNQDGKFSGEYHGMIEIGGFDADTDLIITNAGFEGSGSIDILGSKLKAEELVISETGQITGTFTGSIKAGSHTLSAVSLRTVNGGLVGTAMMDLPGAIGVEVNLQIINGKITATYSGDFMGGLASQASMVITNTGINLSASLNTSQLSTASSQAIQLLLNAAGIAQPLVDGAQILVGEMQVLFDIADLALKGVQATIDGIQASYKVLIDAADIVVTTSQKALDIARNTLSYWNKKIKDLDDWYNGLGKTAQKLAWIAYKADRAALVTSRNIAQTAFNAADTALTKAKTELARLETALDAEVKAIKKDLQDKYDYASGKLANALNALDQLLKEISVLNMEPASIFSVQSMGFKAGLSQLLLGNSFTANARLTFLGQQGQIGFTFNPSNPSASLKTIVTALMTGDSQLSDNDKTPPMVLEVTAAAQQAVLDAEENLLAAESDIVAQIAILEESYADLIFDAELALNAAQYKLNELLDDIANASPLLKPLLEKTLPLVESLVTTARQKLLNLLNELSGKTQILEDEYDSVNDQLTAAQNYLDSLIATSSNGQSEGILIQLKATDNVAVASITYNGSGAQVIPETTVAGDLASILIDAEGITSLSFYATDISGNVSGTTTITTSVDKSAPLIKVETPTDASVKPYNIMITAQDTQGSGISYLTVSANGAEVITETIEWSGSTIVSLTTPGITTLTITAVDQAGNITTLIKEVTVPEEPVATVPGEPTNGDSTSEGGGALGLLWLLLATMMVCLRRTPIQINRHQ